MVNSLSHSIGSKPENSNLTARNSWFVNLITFGEGHHNFHHAYPKDYYHGPSNSFNIGGVILRLLKRLGLVKNMTYKSEESIPNEHRFDRKKYGLQK